MSKVQAATVLILALLVVGGVGSCGVSCAVNGCSRGYSDGTRAGVVTKISKKGLIWKSWEGSMLIGGMTKDESGTLIPQTFEFSVESDDVAKQIEAASMSGSRIQVKYEQYFAGPIRIDTRYVVTHVEQPK